MNWNTLNTIGQLDEIKKESQETPVVIFKHSTRCSISATALDRFERAWAKSNPDSTVKPYLLDLISHRDISGSIAEVFEVEHESPQIILVKNGASVFNESHYGISLADVLEKI